MTKWAFLVGISEYEHARFNNLEFADRHILDFEQIIKNNSDFEANSIISITSSNPDQSKPLKNNIMSSFNKLIKKIQPKDSLFIYFVCHGGSFEGINYIFPSNADKDDGGILKDTSISLRWFIDNLKKAGSEVWNVFFFIDACREQLDKSMGTRELDDTFHITTYENIDKYPTGISFFFSCSENQKSWQFKENNINSSIFSYTLINGLKGGISSPITYSRLVEYVKLHVQRLVNRHNTPDQIPRDYSSTEAKNYVLLSSAIDSNKINTKRQFPSYKKFVPNTSVRRLMKDYGAEIVASEAVEELSYFLQKFGSSIIKDALMFAKNAKRKKITKEDILLAIKYFKPP